MSVGLYPKLLPRTTNWAPPNVEPPPRFGMDTAVDAFESGVGMSTSELSMSLLFQFTDVIVGAGYFKVKVAFAPPAAFKMTVQFFLPGGAMKVMHSSDALHTCNLVFSQKRVAPSGVPAANRFTPIIDVTPPAVDGGPNTFWI